MEKIWKESMNRVAPELTECVIFFRSYFYGHLVNTIYIFEVIYSCNITMESFIIKSCLFGIPLATQASKFGIERPGQRFENETDLVIEK